MDSEKCISQMMERKVSTEHQLWFMAAAASVAADLLASVVRNRTLQLLSTLLSSDTWLYCWPDHKNMQDRLFEKSPLTDQARIYPLLI